MSNTPRRYTGQAVEITYDTRRCIHAAECVRRLPAVFDTARRPWILPDAAPADEIAAVVAKCPSGALHTIRHDNGPAEVPPTPPTVRVTPDGPLHVRGEVRLQRGDGTLLIEETRLALCRCGQSRNKPFCDNSHRAAGFADSGEVPTGDAPASAESPLTITALTNGSLQFQGTFALCGAHGETYPTGRTTLCRCGGSGRKPFCDGLHRRNGFRDQEQADGE